MELRWPHSRGHRSNKSWAAPGAKIQPIIICCKSLFAPEAMPDKIILIVLRKKRETAHYFFSNIFYLLRLPDQKLGWSAPTHTHSHSSHQPQAELACFSARLSLVQGLFRTGSRRRGKGVQLPAMANALPD